MQWKGIILLISTQDEMYETWLGVLMVGIVEKMNLEGQRRLSFYSQSGNREIFQNRDGLGHDEVDSLHFFPALHVVLGFSVYICIVFASLITCISYISGLSYSKLYSLEDSNWTRLPVGRIHCFPAHGKLSTWFNFHNIRVTILRGNVST